MIPHYQLPRNTLLWLFASQLMVLLPHGLRTPPWLVVLLLGCMLWRLQIYRGRWNFPPRHFKLLLLLGSCVGLVMSFPSFFGLEALVSALLVGYGLKLLEMYRKRDALVVLYLSFFLLMTSFLFDQGIGLALYNLFCVMVLVTVLLGLYQQRGYDYPRQSFRRATVLVLQALPLMALMFIILPRLPSFWNIPLQKNTPKSGMSDSMSPGDFSRLALSNALVMRVTFQGLEPPAGELYWRGLVFSHFDGRRWGVEEVLWKKTRGFIPAYRFDDDRKFFLQNVARFGLVEDRSPAAKKYVYDVILEASQTPWLYALSYSIPQTEDIWLSYEQVLAKNGLVGQRYRYAVTSYPNTPPLLSLLEWQHKANLALPGDNNPRARQTARLWREESGSDGAYVQRLLDWYRREFYYTLQPPTLGEDSVDEFLFQSKKGFCEHFAGSFVFMLRAAGIPARVVVGYQGGERNPLENYYLVRQYDAHAWAEVWSPEQGWQRYDPTFAVAPQRILDGFRQTFERSGELDLPLTSLESYRNMSLLNALRLQLDRVNYHWARWVLAYDAEKQLALLSGLMGHLSLARLISYGALALVWLLALVYAALWWQERDRTPDPVLRAYGRFCGRMGKRGYGPQPGESPQRYLRRLALAWPERRTRLTELGESLYTYWYGAGNGRANGAGELCKMLRSL